MKKLEITKGVWRASEPANSKFKNSVSVSGVTICLINDIIEDNGRIGPECAANAAIIADAGNVYQQCELLPSELLKQNKELREALKIANKPTREKDSSKRIVIRYDEWEMQIIEQALNPKP